ncbi:MAG TPA: hypothetical protein VJ063_07745 [Verrucomicrobiae bacterium]|nr:hypothetical protein [Verrucomicrobiae bacterium]
MHRKCDDLRMGTEGNEGATQPEPQLSLDHLIQERILDLLRQAIAINFWSDAIGETVGEASITSWLKLPEIHAFRSNTLVKALLNTRKEYAAFSVEITKTYEREQPRLSIKIRLKEGFEWHNAWEEAWGFAASPNPHCLSDNALKLWQWARSPKNTGEAIDRNRVGRQARLRGSYYNIKELFREIQVKAEPTLVIEGDRLGEPLKIAFWDNPPRYYAIGPLNPPLKLSTKEVNHHEVTRFRKWLYAEIQCQTFPKDNERLGIYDIRDRRTITACFADWDIMRFIDHGTSKFFNSVRLMPGLDLRWQFEDGSGPWLVICSPCDGWTWSRVKQWLQEQATEIPIEQKYGLSKDAAALLRWIIGLRPEEYVGPFTPPVEDNLKVNIGIETKWDEKNLPAYISILAEEINDKTEFDLRLQPWHNYSSSLTRVRVKQKATEMDTVVRSVQLLALSQRKVLDAERVSAAIGALLA